jgi:hypothetical protein
MSRLSTFKRHFMDALDLYRPVLPSCVFIVAHHMLDWINRKHFEATGELKSWPSIARIMAEKHLSRATVKRARTILRNIGAIEAIDQADRHTGGRGGRPDAETTTRYRFPPLWPAEISAAAQAEKGLRVEPLSAADRGLNPEPPRGLNPEPPQGAHETAERGSTLSPEPYREPIETFSSPLPPSLTPPVGAALAKGSAPPAGSSASLDPREVENRLDSLRVRLDGRWPTQRVRDGWGTSSQWLPGIDLEPLRAAIASRIRIDALAKGIQIMLAENIIGIAPAARIARAIEIARTRQAAYVPRGQGPYALRRKREAALAASKNHHHKKNGSA